MCVCICVSARVWLCGNQIKIPGLLKYNIKYVDTHTPYFMACLSQVLQLQPRPYAKLATPHLPRPQSPTNDLAVGNQLLESPPISWEKEHGFNHLPGRSHRQHMSACNENEVHYDCFAKQIMLLYELRFPNLVGRI